MTELFSEYYREHALNSRKSLCFCSAEQRRASKMQKVLFLSIQLRFNLKAISQPAYNSVLAIVTIIRETLKYSFDNNFFPFEICGSSNKTSKIIPSNASLIQASLQRAAFF